MKKQNRPQEVIAAIVLLYLGLAVSFIQIVWKMCHLFEITNAEFQIISIAAGIIIEWSFIHMIWKGHNWARITFLVLFIIGTVFIILAQLQFRSTIPVSGFAAIRTVLQLIALYVLFKKPSSEWFKEKKVK